jgi:hypothetical protein
MGDCKECEGFYVCPEHNETTKCPHCSYNFRRGYLDRHIENYHPFEAMSAEQAHYNAQILVSSAAKDGYTLSMDEAVTALRIMLS